MPKFRKKPVVIEAIHWDGTQSRAVVIRNTFGPDIKIITPSTQTLMRCATLEGDLQVSVGDWVIKGIKGEVYPCKPDIFAATYDEVFE